MISARRSVLYLISTMLVLASLLSGCTGRLEATSREAIGSLIDMGFELIMPTIVTTEQGSTIHTLTLGPSNLFLIEGNEGVVLVDAGVPGLDRIVLAYLDYVGIDHDDLSLIYITHAHPDHYGSAAKLSEATGAKIAVHVDDAATMAAGEFQLGMVRDWEWVSEKTVPTVERILSQLEPTPADFELVDGQQLVDLGIDGLNVDAYVVHTPGHTPGSSVLMLEDSYAFVGDLVSNVGEPHAQESYAGDWRQVAGSLAHVQALEPEMAFAGHGSDPMSAEEFKALQPSFGGG